MIDDKKIITIISSQRHGTNFLCSLLKNNFQEITCYYEIYNEDNDIPVVKELSKMREEDPLQFFKEIVKKTNTQIVCYKIFYDQACKFSLDNENELSLVEALLQISDVVIFLHRDLLNSYISFKKAVELDSWIYKDTTEYKITFDIDDFKDYVSYQNRWFQDTKELAQEQDIPFLDIHYESLVSIETPEQVEIFTSFFNEVFGSESELLFPIQETIQKSEFVKQDKNKEYKDKIENFEEVAGTLQEMGFNVFSTP